MYHHFHFITDSQITHDDAQIIASFNLTYLDLSSIHLILVIYYLPLIIGNNIKFIASLNANLTYLDLSSIYLILVIYYVNFNYRQ